MFMLFRTTSLAFPLIYMQVINTKKKMKKKKYVNSGTVSVDFDHH